MCLAGAGPPPVHRFGPPLKPPPFVSGPGPRVVWRSVIFAALCSSSIIEEKILYRNQLRNGFAKVFPANLLVPPIISRDAELKIANALSSLYFNCIACWMKSTSYINLEVAIE